MHILHKSMDLLISSILNNNNKLGNTYHLQRADNEGASLEGALAAPTVHLFEGWETLQLKPHLESRNTAP